MLQIKISRTAQINSGVPTIEEAGYFQSKPDIEFGSDLPGDKDMITRAILAVPGGQQIFLFKGEI